MQQTTDEDDDPELKVEVDADGYRVDHRSETEQSSQAKEVHEYPDRTEIRLRDEKEVRLEEVKTRETTRRATYDDMIALLDAQLEGLDEIQTSREVTIQEFNRVETTRETVTDGELKREIRTTDTKRKEEILEGPKDSKRVVTTETETLVMQPSPGGLSLEESESPRSQASDEYRTASSTERPSSLVFNPGHGIEPERGGFNVGVTPGEAEFRVRSEGFGGKTPEKTEREVIWIPKPGGNLGVKGDLNFAENTGSLHRIQHRAHRIEELIVEDVDTFYEDQTKPPKRHSGLLGVKKDKRGKSQSPPSTLEKRPKREDIKDQRLTIDVENVTPRSSPERPAQPAGVSITPLPRTDIVAQPDIQVDTGFEVKPRDVIVGPQDGSSSNSMTFVVTYDAPGGVNIRDSGKRKKDVHPKKKKDKRRFGKHQQETDHDMPAEAEFVTYVVNYDRTEPLDGDNKPPRPAAVIAKPEASLPEPSISREPRSAGDAAIEVDMNAGDVKVMEPARVVEERHGDSKTFVVNYEIPAVEKSAKPVKPKKELRKAKDPSYSGSRQPPDEEFTYIVNYDTPSVTPVVTPTSIETTVESPDADSDLEKKAPVYSITVVEPGPGVSVEKVTKSPEKPEKKKDKGSKDAVELTYIVNHGDPQQASLDDTDNLAGKVGGSGDVWIRPPKPAFEAEVRGKEDIKAEPAKLKVDPGNTEPLTFVVEYERGAEEKAKGGVPAPKLKKGKSPDDVVEKMYTYIVNYDQPSSRPLKKDKKEKKEKKGKDVKAAVKVEKPRIQKSHDIELPSKELSFTVQHPFPEPATKPEKPTSELSIAVQHPIPAPSFEVREQIQEYSITVDRPFPEPVTKPEEQFEEFSIAVEHPFPEPVTKPEERFEEFSIAVDHPFPEPAKEPEEQFEEFSIAIEHPFPEPPKEPEERFEEFSIEVDHPFPEPPKQPEEQFEEFSIAIEQPFPEPAKEPEEQFEEFSIAIEHPFPEPVREPEDEFEEFSISVDHPIPEAHLEIKEPVLPQPKLPAPIPSKGAGESLTYVVTYDTPTASGEGKPAKTKKKRKPLFSKGSKPSAKAEVATETSPDIAQTFTYVVNYDGPAVRPERPVEPKPSKTEVFGKADVKVPKPEIKTSVEIPGPKVTVGQSEELSITVAQPIPTISGATQAGVDISPPESAEGVTYIVHHEEPFAVVKTTEKPKKTHKKEAELKIKKPQLETKYEVDVLPEESAMPLPSSTLTYVVNYDQPVGKAEKVGGAKGKRGWRFEGKKPKAALEVDAPKVVVKTPVVTPKIPEPPAVSESISYTIVHDQPEPPEVGASIVTDGQWKPDSSEDMRFTVDYDLPLKTEQEDEVPEIEVEAPASIELISPSTEDVGLELRDIRQRRPPTPEIPHTDISVSIERPDIPAPALAIPATTGESRTYIVQYEEPRAKAIGKEKPEKVKTKGKGWAFQKKKPPASADIEAKGASLSTETYEVYVTTDQPKASVSAELPKGTAKVSAVKPTPTVTTPSKDVSTEQFTYIVNYDGGREVIPTPEIRDTSATIEVEAVDVPQIEPFEIREPEVDIEEPSSRLSITVEEPFTEVSAEFEPPAPEISFKVKEPVVPVVATPDVALRKEGAAETITYVVTHEDPAALKISGKVKPDKKEKKRGFAFPGKKKYYKDIKAGASFEAKGPEITTEIAGGVPLYEVTVKTEQPEPSVDVKKKKPEVSVTTPEAAILIPSKGLDVQVPTQPQSITYVVSYDDSEKAIPKSKLKKTTDSKRKDITAPKVKPPKAPKGKILSGEGESMTYVVTYDDTAKFIPPPQLEGSEELKIEVQNIPEIKSPEIPQAELDIEEPISELTITVGQPIPEIIEEVKPPTPEIKVKEPSEVEQLTITVEQPLPEISAEVKPPTPEVKIKNTTDSKRKDITAPKVKPPKAPKGKIISGEGESMTYVVTYDDAAKFIPPPQLEGSEELKIEVQNIPEIKSPEIPQAELDIEEPISELTITVGQPIPEISAEVKPPTPEIKVKEPSEVEQWTIRVEQPLPEISAEVKPPTPELKIRQPSGVEQLSITVEQPLPEVSREIKLPTPEVKVKKPAKVVVTPPSVTLPQTDSLQTFTYIVTHDEPTSKISGEAKPEKKEKKKRVFSFPAKKITKEVKIEGELEAKKPKAAAEVATGVPIYEVTVITEKPEAAAHVETKQPEVSIETPKPVIEGPSLTDVESFTYVVSYDDAGKVLLPEIKETVAIKVQREDIALEIPEAEVKLEEPSLELTISVEHPLPEVSAKVKAPTPEIEVRGPSKVVVGPPSVEIPQGSASAAETVTFIVTHEDPLLKTDVEAKPVKKDKKKRGFVFPVKKVSKDVKAGAGVKATVPEITAEIAEGVPLYEVSVTTEHHEPPVDVKKKKPKVSVTAPKAAISITKPSADTAVHEETQAQSITYVVAYDVAEKRTPPPAKKKAAKVEVETMHIPKITIPEKPEAKLQVEEQSSQLTITVEQPLPEISAEVRPPTPEVKIREPSEIEEFTITVEQPLPEISAEVKPPTPEVKIREPHGVEKLTITVEQPLPEISAEVKPSTPEVKIRQPSETEQFTITVEQPLLEVSTKVKPPIKDVKVKKQSEIVVGPPSVELSKGGTAETITYIVTQEDRPSKLPEAVESKEKEKKKKIHFPRLHFGKTYKVSGDTQLKDSEVSVAAKGKDKPKSKANIKTKKPEIDLSKEEVVTYVVKYDDQSKAISAPEVKPPKIPESKIKLKEPSSELTITVEQPLPDISAEVKPPTPEIKVKQPSETEQFTITVEQPLPEISAEVKPPSPEVKIKETSEIEQFTITVEQPLPEISAEVKPSTPEVKIRQPSETEQFKITVEQPLLEVSTKVKPPIKEVKVKKPSEIVVGPPSVELSKGGTAETITYIVTQEDRPSKIPETADSKEKEKKKKIHFPRLHFGKTYKVSGDTQLKDSEVSVAAKGKDKPKSKANIKAKKSEIDLSKEEVVTYVVKYDDQSKAISVPEAKAPKIPETKIKLKEPSSELTITVEQPLPDISAEVKPSTPEVKIKEPSEIEEFTITVEQPLPEISADVKPPTPEVKIKETYEIEQFTITVEQPLPEISAEVNPPTTEVKIRQPSESEQFRITVEQPLPEVSTKVKPAIKEVKVKKPSEVAVGPPSVELSKGGTAETITYIVTQEDRPSKIPEAAESKEKEKKKKIHFPRLHFGKTYKISGDTQLKDSEVAKGKEKPKSKAIIKSKKPEIDLSKEEVVTYVVKYDDQSKAISAPEVKAPKIPESKIKLKEPSSELTITVKQPLPDISAEVKPSTAEVRVKQPSETEQFTITVEQPLPEISAEVKPPTPEVKIREPSEIEQFTITVEQPLPEISAEVKPSTPEVKVKQPSEIEEFTITVEQPLPEISADVKPPTPEVKIRQPSESEQFRITVEQPLPEVSTKVKPAIKEVKVKKPSEVVVGPPSVELSKGGTAETITYIVTQEDRPSKIPEAAESKKKEKKKKIHFPRLHFGKTYKVSGDTQLKDSEVAKETEKPKSKAIIKSKKPEIDLSKEEVVTYVVKYDDQSKAISAPEVKPPKIPESKIKLKEPSSELTITVEQPLPDISAEVKPPTPEIKVKQPSETEQFTITVEQPLPEINAKVKPPTPEVKIREPSEIEQFTITVEQPLPEISAEVKPPTPEVKIREPHGVEELTITVEQPLPEISAEVKPLTPEVKIREPSETEQFTITVEQPLPEITAEAKLPTPETSVKAPSKLVVKPPSVELPKTGAAETVTYIVNHEEPAVKTSGEVKVKSDKKETKQIGIRLPGKKVTKEPKAGAGVAAKGPTAEVTGEVPVYEVSVTTEQPESPAEPGVAAAKGGVIRKEGVETVTYVVEHDKEGQAKEGISAEGQKKRTDWIWRVKKPAKSIDISSDSQERSVGRIEPDAGISAKIEEPKLGISAEAETPGRDVSVSTGKAGVAPEISRLTGTPETHTYIVTYDEPHVTTTSKGKPKRRWPFSRREAPPGKLEVKAKPKKNKWTLFKKKEPKLVKPRVDIELAEIKPAEVTVGETIRGDIDVSVPAAPSIALEQKAATVGDILGTVAIPVAPDYSITITREELPSGVSVTAPRPELTISETGEAADLEAQAQQKKPTDVSQAKIDVEAKLPGRKEQVLAEKVISGRAKVAAGAEAEERKEPKDKDRSVITGGGGRREEENAEEETVVYIVNYEQPFGTLTKTKDAAKETPGPRPSTETAAETEKTEVTTKNVQPQVQVQMPQLEQCILVPIRDESSPEDRFYGTEAPVPAWPPVDIDGEDDDTEPSSPHFEEDIRSPDVTRQLETSTRSVDEKQLPPHLVVVAVDFGTTFSGYAFSFSRDSSGSIHVMRKWEGGDPGAVDHKTPTILLLTPGGQFHSFGFTARDFYHDLSPKEAARWLYFEKFKMALHFNDELNTDTKLAAANGQCVPAIDVFTHALRFFRKHVLQEVSDQVSTDVLNEDIYWIITVPAIWTEEAKQFMRLAAYRAGIASPNYPDQLLISLEPEAASIYVRKQRLHQLVPDVPFQRRRSCRRSVTPEPTAVNQPIVATERKVLPTDSGQLVKTTTTVTVSWPVVTTIPQTDITVGHQVDTAGSRYMVVDCGGGTVDITVHEIQSRDGTLKELHRATGGPFGSVAVDQEFEKLLVDIFGVDFIDVFKSKRPAGWVDLLMAFESRKRAANPYITKPLNVSLPFSFIDYHKKYRNCPVEHAIRKYNNRDIRWSSQGMLRLMPDAMNRLFLPAIDKIKEAIGNVLNDSEVKGLRFLFLVGGFADSPMLQLSIRQDFGHLLRIIIPNDASISILKGAVCFGLDPSVITTRKSRMTYGVGVLNRFVPGQHPQSKLILKDGEEWCTDVFDALVYADQSVAIGDTVLRRYTLVPGDADDVTVSKVVNIYSSDRRDVKYVTERGVTRCGTLCLTDDETKKPLAGRQDQKDREVQVRMTFGQTEIKVTAFELGTRKSVRATIDFLNK